MDDVFEQDMPEDTEAGGNFLTAEGSYHLIVIDVNPRPMNAKGELMQAFRVKFGVLAGTVDAQAGKEIDILFFDPKMDQKNQGEFAKKRQARFWLATGMADKNDKKIKASFTDVRGRHCVARLEKTDDGKYLQLAFLEIYHIDDQEVVSVPKDTAAIDALPKEWGRIGAQPAAIKGQDAEYAEPVAKGAAVNVDDL
jgi:hypothetical protein